MDVLNIDVGGYRDMICTLYSMYKKSCIHWEHTNPAQIDPTKHHAPTPLHILSIWCVVYGAGVSQCRGGEC